MILLQQTYRSSNAIRQQEIDYVKQCNNTIFSKIEDVSTPKRATYKDLFEVAKSKYKDNICIIANNDIIFDKSIFLAEKILEDNMIIALTRWNTNYSPSMEGTIGEHDYCLYSHSQDVWIFKPNTLNDFDNNFCLGIPKCDNRLAFEAVTNGIKLINPALDIKTYHHHDSGIRTWTEHDSYFGNLFLPKLTNINNCNTEGLMIKQDNKIFFKGRDNSMNQIVSLEDFYKTNKIAKDFDEIFYKNLYKEVENFYQPYCKEHDIDDKHRLYYHYAIHGINNNYKKNLSDFLKNNITGILITKLDSDIEEFWPVHKNHYIEYQKKLLLGKSISKNSNISVVGMARNCGKNIEKNIEKILSLSCNNIKLFVYENDSTDDTKNILQNIQTKNQNISISLNTHNVEYLTDRSRTRTANLATYRNICLDWVRTYYNHYDYTIVIDLDADLGFSIDGIYNSIYWLNNIPNAGGMASYSLYLKATDNAVEFAHYDSFAVRLNNWNPMENNRDDNNEWFRLLHPLVGSDPIPMYSCFGGLCIYKTAAFLNGAYDGSIGCEHILFHKSLKDKGYNIYLNPSSRFFSVFDLNIGAFYDR